MSRQCAHRWVARFDAQGWEGLADRSSRPLSCPTRTSVAVEAAVVAYRDAHRVGRDRVAAATGVPARTVSRVLARAGRPPLAALDPVTGVVIRASRSTALRYERPAPGDLLHVDVKKLGKIPDGGGWRAHGRVATVAHKRKSTPIGFDYVHSAVDDHTRLAYSEVLQDEKGPTCAAFLARAAAWFASVGVPTIRQVMTDNAFAYRYSADLATVMADLDAQPIFIRPHCPWQNGKVERFNRTLQTEWAYRQTYTTNADRTAALARWLTIYNTERHHHGIGGTTPISRVVTPT